MAGLDSYDNATKQAWRGWQWNQIVAHLPEFINKPLPSKGSAAMRNVTFDKVALYLGGSDDLDGRLAMARGFQRHNLIAIDSDPKCIKRLRKQGALVVGDDLFDIVQTWPAERTIDVVVADFCGGLHNKIIDGLATIVGYCQGLKRVSPGGRCGTVLSVNLSRCREPNGKEYRQWISEVYRWVRPLEVSEKHRGFMWLAMHFDAIASGVIATNGWDKNPKLAALAMKEIWRWANPVFSSYKNKTIHPDTGRPAVRVLDSVIYTIPMVAGDILPPIPATARKLAALQAIRTMKRRGDF